VHIEAIHTGVAILLQFYQEGGSHAHTPLDQSHTHLKHGHLLHSEPSSVYINCGLPLIVLHILVECPLHGEGCFAFHQNGTLSDTLGDDCCSISNVLACLTL
jgi:hypothetical protein